MRNTSRSASGNASTPGHSRGADDDRLLSAVSFASGSVFRVEPTQHQHLVFPVLTYFSLTTLATIGYGDIIPLTLQARYAAVAEGITGQMYLAILVGRLVGLHMNQSQRT